MARPCQTSANAKISLCLLVLATVSLLYSCRRPTQAPPTRVVLVTIDTLRADHLGMNGYPRNTSPFLDRLAREGVSFAAARATSSHTAPSHASLFTGLYPVEHGVRNNGETLDESIPTLAELYRDAGYETASFSTVRFLRGVQRGFEHQHWERRFHNAGSIIENAWKWLEPRRSDDRFFLWIHLFDVHEWYRPARISRRSKRTLFQDQAHRGESINRWLEERYQEQHRQDKTRLFRALDHYDAQIINVDEQLSWLFDKLKEQGMGENTLWIVTSDHGEGLYNHDYAGHGAHVHRQQLEVPLVFYWPEAGWNGGRRIEGLVQHVDLGQTLADLVPGDLSPSTASTYSLRAQLEGVESRSARRSAMAIRRPKGDDPLLRNWPDGEVVAIEDERYKVIGNLQTDTSRFQSYDLTTDRLEWSPYQFDGSDHAQEGAAALVEELIARHQAMVEVAPAPGADLDELDRKELEALGYLSPEEKEEEEPDRDSDN